MGSVKPDFPKKRQFSVTFRTQLCKHQPRPNLTLLHTLFSVPVCFPTATSLPFHCQVPFPVRPVNSQPVSPSALWAKSSFPSLFLPPPCVPLLSSVWKERKRVEAKHPPSVPNSAPKNNPFTHVLENKSPCIRSSIERMMLNTRQSGLFINVSITWTSFLFIGKYSILWPNTIW